MDIEAYTRKFRDWVLPYFKEKKPAPTTHRATIRLTPNELSILHINKSQDMIELLHAESFQYDNYDTLSKLLSSIIQKHDLSNIPTYWLLSPADYQLFLIESMPVPKEELKEALTWRIRSLINFPVQDTLIDYFLLPPKKSSVNSTVAAVVAKASSLNTMIDIFQINGIHLTTIDIPELACRNLTARDEEDEKTTAFIYFYDDTMAILNITCKKTLYFTRRIPLYPDNQPGAIQYEQLSLDIMRYFDYFQTQWRHPTPTQIFVAGEKRIDVVHIAKTMSEQLLLKVEPYSLQSQFSFTDEIKMNLVQKDFLLELGCALREEKSDAPSRN